MSLHGKTYDYKIPIKTIMRLFLLPHKDGRHLFFVVSFLGLERVRERERESEGILVLIVCQFF